MKRLILAVALLTSTAVGAVAQDALNPLASPYGLTRLMVGDVYVKVTYNRPHAKDRKLFGEEALVPYGEVWRTGANETTEITTTGDLKVAGETLPAGTYSFYTIPGPSEWTVIFNSAVAEWGAYRYDKSKDVLRVTVPVVEGDAYYEPFSIMAAVTGERHGYVPDAKGQALVLAWGDTMVRVPVELP